jgi:hypothetical protein
MKLKLRSQMNRQFCDKKTLAVTHMKVFLQWYESLDVDTIYCTNILIKEPKLRIIENLFRNWGLVSWKNDLGAIKWI